MPFDSTITQSPRPNCDDHKDVQADLFLIKHELGIKDLKNGDRDKQIREAREKMEQIEEEAKVRMDEIGQAAEEEDKTINEKIINLDKRMVVGEAKMASIEMYQKLILTALLGILGAIILFFIEFNWKTFILGI